MPLRATLHSWMPDEDVRHSHGTAWVCALVGWLNRKLPREDYRADPDVQSEVKVLEELRERPAPPPTKTTSVVLPDRQQVIVTEQGDALRPVAIIALVTPRTRMDRRKRAMFVARCLGALANGTGLLVIDAVPDSTPSPCAELAAALDLSVAIQRMSALSFRTTLRGNTTELDVWLNELTVGQPIPSVPLGLRGGPVVLLDLEGTYTAAIKATGL